jgi:hypothetical protein
VKLLKCRDLPQKKKAHLQSHEPQMGLNQV